MENRYLDVVLGELAAFFEENGFKEQDGAYSNGTKALKIEYDEGKSVYMLLVADVNEGEIGEYSTASTYLFTDEHNRKDAVSVGIDFLETARKAIGAKGVRRSAGETELPTANTPTISVNTLTAKLLAIYPEFKETYKEETAAKGKFLYLDFYTTYFIPEIRKTLDEGGKKNVKKLIDMMCELFVTGDRAVTNLIVAVLAAAIGKDEKRFKTATERMEECPHLVTAVNNEILVLARNKKFQKAMKFEG